MTVFVSPTTITTSGDSFNNASSIPISILPVCCPWLRRTYITIILRIWQLSCSKKTFVHIIRVMLPCVQNEKSEPNLIHSRIIGENFTISCLVPYTIEVFILKFHRSNKFKRPISNTKKFCFEVFYSSSVNRSYFVRSLFVITIVSY